MASPAQIAANQLNSRKSTGPRAPEDRRGMANYRKYEARASGRCDGHSGVGWQGAQPDSSEDPARPAAATKSEIRNSKFEIRRKYEAQILKTQNNFAIAIRQKIR